MNKPVYIENIALISPLGNNVEEHFSAFLNGESGIQVFENSGYNNTAIPLAKFIGNYDTLLSDGLLKAQKALAERKITVSTIIVSSTKGNLDLLPEDCFQSTQKLVQNYFPESSLTIVSNACISGVLAIQHGVDIIRQNGAENILVIGIDVVSDFVVYGFQSLFALSESACKPFDEKRNGTTLGEACGVVLLTQHPTSNKIQVLAGASSNDANHISGPSRTGEGLVRCVNKTLSRAQIQPKQIDFISAHGTATVFNDEMESIAFERLELTNKPINSMKGYFGHTLGAAGVIETIMSIVSMEKNILFPSLGFESIGTSMPLNILTKTKEEKINTVLKTASGFGGGNASILLQKQV